ncbi:MAG: cysteine synthase A [Pseudomonadota bacterium]
MDGKPQPAARPRAHGRIYDDITQTIGATPVVRLSRALEDARLPDPANPPEILAKLEFFNPLGSVKDRIGVAMIEAMEAEGTLASGSVLIEATSGNTGIGLAFAAAAKGYRLILCMPETMSVERRKMLALLGAELVLVRPSEGMGGAVARAEALAAEIPGAVIARQFDNPANPAIHAATTAEEIWTDLGGRLDVLVVGVGTGGTATGVGQVLKARLPDLHIVAVEPEDSAVLSGGPPGPHKIQGIGAGFVPGNLDRGLIDEVLTVANATAFDTARALAAREGIAGGISSGAAVAAAVEIAERRCMAGKRVLAILPSFAERYLSTPLFDGL